MEDRAIFEVHPVEDELDEYIFGRLSEDRCALFEEHFLICGSCRRKLEQADEFALLMRQGIVEVEKAPPRRPLWGWPMISAIGVAAALLLVLIPYRVRTEMNPVPVQLVSFRAGDGSMTQARAGSGVDLTVDCTDLEAPDLKTKNGFRIEMVDSVGRRVWNGNAVMVGSKLISARVAERLTAGVYWVRIYSGNELLREFGLRLL